MMATKINIKIKSKSQGSGDKSQKKLKNARIDLLESC
jgi:hypothetical protein